MIREELAACGLSPAGGFSLGDLESLMRARGAWPPSAADAALPPAVLFARYSAAPGAAAGKKPPPDP